MKIALMRHGETELNTRRVFLSRTNAELNEAGTRQAKSAARSMRVARWSAIHASPLARSAQVAHIIAGELHLPVRLLDGLRERELGELEGVGITEYAQSHPAEYSRLVNDRDYAPPGGETQYAVLHRVEECLKGIAGRSSASAPGPVMVVTHGGVLAILGRGLGLTEDRIRTAVRHCQLVCLEAELDAGHALRAQVQHWDVAPDVAAAWAGQAPSETASPPILPAADKSHT